MKALVFGMGGVKFLPHCSKSRGYGSSKTAVANTRSLLPCKLLVKLCSFVHEPELAEVLQFSRRVVEISRTQQCIPGCLLGTLLTI